MNYVYHKFRIHFPTDIDYEAPEGLWDLSDNVGSGLIPSTSNVDTKLKNVCPQGALVLIVFEKNRMKNFSIRFRITVAFFLLLVLMLLAAMGLSRLAGKIVLENTLRSYLISTVDQNIEMIQAFEPGLQESGVHNDILISSHDNTLLIHEHFLKSIHDVESALYQEDGQLLYGKNLLPSDPDVLPFRYSHVYRLKLQDMTCFVYDRELKASGLEGLWIRGIVPLTNVFDQLSEMTRLLFSFLPVLTILSVLFSYLLAGYLLQPIRVIEKTASEISLGMDLTRRIQIRQGNDELHRLADAFNRMFDRLEQAFLLEQQFSSNASHELRTPMSVILAQTEYTLEGSRSPEEYREAMQVIKRQGKRMEALINSMLTYTRMENKADSYPLSCTDISSLTDGICSDLKLLQIRGITLTCSITPAITIQGNRILLEQLLQNLIDNAYKYGRDNGHIRVTLTIDRGLSVGASGSCRICLTVTDDGPGIPRKEQERIFDRFYRTEASRTSQGDTKGFGLGLAVAKKIMEIHHGQIVVDSHEHEYTSFHCFFPYNP